MHICDSGDLCRYPMHSEAFVVLMDYYSDICHLLISGVGVKIATDILCESDGCHCKLPVSR